MPEGAPATAPPTPGGAPDHDPEDSLRSADLEALLPPPTPRRELWKAVAVVGVVLLLALAFGWYSGWFTPSKAAGPPPCPTELGIVGTGSASVAPLVAAYGHSLGQSTGCYQIGYNGTGSAMAVAGLSARTVDYVATDAPLNATEFADLSNRIVTLPVAIVGIAVVYHVPGVGTGLRLDPAVLAGIYLGTVTEWNDPAIASLNPGTALPSGTPIVPLRLSDPGGTTRLFSEYLASGNATWDRSTDSGMSPRWPVGTAPPSDSSLVASVASTVGAIGYAAWGLAAAAGDDVAELPAANGGFVAPDPASLAAAEPNPASLPAGNASWAAVSLLNAPPAGAYPLASFAYLITFQDLGNALGPNLSFAAAAWLAYFFTWAALHGMNDTAPVDFAPISSAQATADIQVLELLTYHGVPLAPDADRDNDARLVSSLEGPSMPG